MKYTGKLLVAGGVVATLALASYCIYGYFQASMADNQNHAYRVMCQIHNAQMEYSSRNNQSYWTSDVAGITSRIKELHESADAADVTTTESTSAAAKPYHGYFFKALPLPKSGEPGFGDHMYAIVAFPQKYGRTGRRTYYINGLGRFSKDLQGGTQAKPLELIELRTTGWSIID